jgi:hypothetical protein
VAHESHRSLLDLTFQSLKSIRLKINGTHGTTGTTDALMRIAALYDIHGNVPALEAIIREFRELGGDRIVVGGDVVPGPMPEGILSALASLDIPVDSTSAMEKSPCCNRWLARSQSLCPSRIAHRSDYPDAEQFATRCVLAPSPEEEMLKAFSKAELK